MSNPVEKYTTPDKRIHERLALLIDTLLQDKNVRTFRTLEKLTGVDYNTIHKWARIKADPQLQKLIKFTYSLGWSMSELMIYAEGDEDPKEAIARKKKELLENSALHSDDSEISSEVATLKTQ